MKKSLLILVITALIAGGCGQKKQKQQQQPETIEDSSLFGYEDYEIIDDEEDDSNHNDGYLCEYQPENIAFASEIVDFSSSMSMPFNIEHVRLTNPHSVRNASLGRKPHHIRVCIPSGMQPIIASEKI